MLKTLSRANQTVYSKTGFSFILTENILNEKKKYVFWGVKIRFFFKPKITDF